jgi:hypothetical protein
MQLTVAYRITGLGWSECVISDEKNSCTVTASYLSDALGHLLLAATAAACLFRRVTFSFEEEPGEYRWVITSPRMNEIEVEIFDFSESWSDKPDDAGKSIFKTKCLPDTFARAVLSAAQQVLGEHGEAGYADKWGEHPFPMLQFRELERILELQA